ncbi:MAG TPA: bifunctional adenosylcobinamide kinase/adenosylcobinamide-phosphate guanylyltransferase [Candidatus Dormibacteraeota bacterium]|nr:bifunctional adenosylcobinamide kinase/adenosylcobinamide-phosphate guanylyltransferase [Candidatus Dormibacteraeota bacterium]
MPLLFLVGGARSGKSRLARLLAQRTGGPVTFIATGQARDREMEERIARHRDERPAGWRTIEAPLDLRGALSSVDAGDCVIVDCLTLWVANLLEAGAGVDEVLAAARTCAQRAAGRGPTTTIVVSNEVGLGIVPTSALARAYRDALGSTNAAFADAADRSLLVVAGRALELRAFGAFLDQADSGSSWDRGIRLPTKPPSGMNT